MSGFASPSCDNIGSRQLADEAGAFAIPDKTDDLNLSLTSLAGVSAEDI